MKHTVNNGERSTCLFYNLFCEEVCAFLFQKAVYTEVIYPLTARRLRPLRWEMNCVCYLLDRAS